MDSDDEDDATGPALTRPPLAENVGPAPEVMPAGEEDPPIQELWQQRQPFYGPTELEADKLPRHIRVILLNLQRLPLIKEADRSTQLMINLGLYQPDVAMLNDVGIHWPSLLTAHSWEERTRGVLPFHRRRFSYNIHDKSGEQVQWGGTGLLIFDQLKPRVFKDLGTDSDHLGRWTWARIQGREGTFLRIISAYRPVVNNQNEGSSYQQQKRYFRSKQKFEDPLVLFDLHLKHLLQEWLHEGDQIILGLDMNADVRTSKTATMLRELGLTEAILKHNRPDPPPETNYKNGNRVPIDGIFTTANIRPTQAGYTGYNVIMQSDHRGLWMDIPFESALGFNPPNLHKRDIKSVRAHDPRSVDIFNKLVHEGFKKEHDQTPKNLALLKQLRIDGAPLEEIIALHSQVLSDSNRIRLHASNRARKVFMGRLLQERMRRRKYRFWTLPVKFFTTLVQSKTGSLWMRHSGDQA